MKHSKPLVLVIIISLCALSRAFAQYVYTVQHYEFESSCSSFQLRTGGLLLCDTPSMARLTEDTLKKYKWEEKEPHWSCSYYFEFGANNKGIGYGCNLVGVLEFKYKIIADTLIIDNRPMMGKYIFTGYSLVLVKVYEWNDASEWTEIVVPRRHEYIKLYGVP